MHNDAEDYAGRASVKVLSKPGGHPGCKYYGNSNVVLRATGRLMSSAGNQCAVIFDAHAPCQMEKCGQEPDERICSLARTYEAEELEHKRL